MSPEVVAWAAVALAGAAAAIAVQTKRAVDRVARALGELASRSTAPSRERAERRAPNPRQRAKLPEVPEFNSFRDFVKGMMFDEGVVFSSDGLVVENCSNRGSVLAPYAMEAVRALEKAGVRLSSAIMKLDRDYALLVRIGRSGSRELYAFFKHPFPPSLNAPDRLAEVLKECLVREGVEVR